MKKRMMRGLYAAFCLSWAGVIACVVLHEDIGGHWPWMLSVCAAMLFTLLLLFIWLWWLVRGLYRWHPAVREALLGMLSLGVMIWGFSGFERVTRYELHLADCTGVCTTPTWHVSPLQKACLAATEDWSEGRFGFSLLANMTEWHGNYRPTVGHGPCRVEFSVCEHIYTRVFKDAFTLYLPKHADSALRLQMADTSSALGLILVSSPEQADSWRESKLSPQQWAAAHGHPWIPLTPGVPIDMPEFQGYVHFYIAYRPGPSSDAPANSTPYDMVHFAVRQVE